MLRAGIVFGRVCVSLSVRTKSQNYLSEIDVTGNYAPWWTLEVVRSWWPLTLRAIFVIFQFRLHILNVWDTYSEYLSHSSVSRSLVQGQGYSNEKAVARNSKTTRRKLLGLDWNICYDNARSNLELLLFWPWPLTMRHIFVCFNSSSMLWMPQASSFIFSVKVHL